MSDKYMSVTTLGNHLIPCINGQLDEYKKKQRASSRKYQKGGRAKVKSLFRNKREAHEKKAEEILGGPRPVAKPNFIKVLYCNPVSWDVKRTPKKCFPLGYQVILRDALHQYV